MSLTRIQFDSKFKCLSEHKQDFECKKCLNVLLEPQQCVQCQAQFCQACSETKICINQTHDFQPKPLHRILRNQLNSLRFKCFDCSEELLYTQTYKHFDSCKKSNGEIEESRILLLQLRHQILEQSEAIEKKKADLSQLKDHNVAQENRIKVTQTENVKLKNELKKLEWTLEQLRKEGEQDSEERQSKQCFKNHPLKSAQRFTKRTCTICKLKFASKSFFENLSEEMRNKTGIHISKVFELEYTCGKCKDFSICQECYEGKPKVKKQEQEHQMEIEEPVRPMTAQ